MIFCILASVFLFIFMLAAFHRSANIKDFLTENAEDVKNILSSWILVSAVDNILLSVLLSQFIPIVPKFISDIQIYDYQLNKFGFTFVSVTVFHLLKNAFTFLFYSSVGNREHLEMLALIATRFYFIESLILIVLNFSLYFYPVDLIVFFRITVIFLAGFFILKNLIYFFHNQPILPEKWYYKFLYICTLQIVPIFVLWKFLFY